MHALFRSHMLANLLANLLATSRWIRTWSGNLTNLEGSSTCTNFYFMAINVQAAQLRDWTRTLLQADCLIVPNTNCDRRVLDKSKRKDLNKEFPDQVVPLTMLMQSPYVCLYIYIYIYIYICVYINQINVTKVSQVWRGCIERSIP